MITVAESRLTIIVIISYTLSIWLFVTVIIQIYAGCPESDPVIPTADACALGSPTKVRFRLHFMGALIVKAHLTHRSDEFICDTIIISRYWSLTPAHCTSVFKKHSRKFIVIRSDSLNWHLNGQEHNIHHYLVHKNYSKVPDDYDIAMVRVIQPFRGARTSYAQLPAPTCRYDVTAPATILSWKIGTVAGKVRKIRAWILDDSFYETRFNTSRTLRVSQYGPLEHRCLNKHGALLLHNKTAVAIKVGSADCASNSSHDVYLNLAYFRDTIQHVLDNCNISSVEKCEELTDFVPSFVQAQVRASVPGYFRRKAVVS